MTPVVINHLVDTGIMRVLFRMTMTVVITSIVFIIPNC